ncbi:MAG: DUF2207 domain-containing protein [Deltaproteobacteria bacterium]|jgi:uncharacterized membrane protein YgcG|nr:DUF2207 domain-containing protein [Deltaproteobacteria bacterium]
MKRKKSKILILMVCGGVMFLLSFAAVAQQTERILRFKSHIRIHNDGGMTVTETIAVYAAGQQIKRGIYRDFPTQYKDRFGNTVHVGFEVMSVFRNGLPEAFHLKKTANGIRVYMGQKNQMLRTGKHAYMLIYRTQRQLGHFDKFDELYWNVTGNGWSFYIEEAQAMVELPPNAEILEVSGYTGPRGAQWQNFSVNRNDPGNIHFVTTRPLRPREGLTIAVSWPKGFVPTPSFTEKIGYFLSNNPTTIAAVLGMIILMSYYLWVWFKIGRDPDKGPIIPLFSPPKGFTPGAVRFVTRMGFDHKAFASAVVDMAVKGFLNIQENGDKFILSKTGTNGPLLSMGERMIAKNLFQGRTDRITLETANHTKIGKAVNAFKKSLKIDFEKRYFQRNSRWLIPGGAISLMTLVCMVLSAPEVGAAIFLLVWLSIWTLACFGLVLATVKAWKTPCQSDAPAGYVKKSNAISLSLFTFSFVIFWFFGMWALGKTASFMVVVVLFLIIAINVIFYHLMKAPTIFGRRIMDQIEGFKLYLSVAEKQSLAMQNPPEKTSQLFEKYLPYALALDVENQWSEQFADVLAQAGKGSDYSPTWYAGNNWHSLGASGMINSLGSSFSAAISSSSSPPGSSSGGGGGGSSGGGGGGGGGGGW